MCPSTLSTTRCPERRCLSPSRQRRSTGRSWRRRSGKSWPRWRAPRIGRVLTLSRHDGGSWHCHGTFPAEVRAGVHAECSPALSRQAGARGQRAHGAPPLHDQPAWTGSRCIYCMCLSCAGCRRSGRGQGNRHAAAHQRRDGADGEDAAPRHGRRAQGITYARTVAFSGLPATASILGCILSIRLVALWSRSGGWRVGAALTRHAA
jgi:hypothetical protein